MARLGMSLYCAIAVGLVIVGLYLRLEGQDGADLVTQGVALVERLGVAVLAFLFGDQRARSRDDSPPTGSHTGK